jgi:2-hydroxychromene-2-carboxylate isomerase
VVAGRPRFFVDVGSPYAWLAAERVERVLGVEVVWEPVLLGAIFAARGFSSWSLTDARAAGIEEVERRAAAYGLPEVRWPEPWPGDMLLAMRCAAAADARGAAPGLSAPRRSGAMTGWRTRRKHCASDHA